MMKKLVLVIPLVFALVLVSCGKDKTEQEQYRELQGSLKYRAYRTLTNNALPPAIRLYNQQRETNMPEVDVGMVRLLLGYGWAVSQKPAFAMVEGNLVRELKGGDELTRLLGHSVIAIAMYEQGWKELAKAESNKAVGILKKESGRKNARETLMAAHLLLGTANIYGKDYKAARFHFAGFSAVTKIDWPYNTVDALADIAEGNIQQGLTKLKKMSRDENLPPEVRQAIAEGVKKIEAEAGPVDSYFFWPRLISRLAYKELKKAANPAINSLMKLVDEVGDKVGLK